MGLERARRPWPHVALASVALLCLVLIGCGINAEGDDCASCGLADSSFPSLDSTLGDVITSRDTGGRPHPEGSSGKHEAAGSDEHSGDSMIMVDSSPPKDSPADTGHDAGQDTGVDSGHDAGCSHDCQIGASCTSPDECCSGVCPSGTCEPSGTGGACCGAADCESRNCMSPMNMCGPPSCSMMGNKCGLGTFCDTGGPGPGECCSNVCTNNQCAPVTMMSGMGGPCCGDGDCESNNCTGNNTCGPPSCASTCAIGHFCDNNGECCSQTCTMNQCALAPAGMGGGCCGDGDCCSGQCDTTMHQCQAAPPKTSGGTCCTNGDCCSNSCGGGICSLSSTGGQCCGDDDCLGTRTCMTNNHCSN